MNISQKITQLTSPEHTKFNYLVVKVSSQFWRGVFFVNNTIPLLSDQ